MNIHNLFRYGPPARMVRFMVTLSWPIMTAARKWSSMPVLKWIINPFFARPWNELTTIPVNVNVAPPESVPVPGRVLERLVQQFDDIFIVNECICRGLLKCENYPPSIGCMALGPAVSRMHPSHGRRASSDEAAAHIRRAAEAGLVPTMAHCWIDPLAFGLTGFKQLMFICFCDECCCLYRTHMKKRGPNLDRAYQKLPGISVSVDPDMCTGCGICAERCFVAAITMDGGTAKITDDCKGCGQCVEYCPENAVTLHVAGEEELFSQLRDRLYQQCDIRFNE